MKKLIYMLLIIIVISFYFTQTTKDTYVIPEDSIRFRIIANSNTDLDQTTKLLIKKDLESNLFPLLENSKSVQETREIINSNQDLINDTISKYNIPYKVNFGYNYFPTKEYLGNTYQEGNYESLVISLGESAGDNWWCVMYPPLCLLESQHDEIEEVEYTSLLKEIFSKLTS